jgi:ornithine cyclodeaminase/alanine dehydrogenase-like protein (mu-crystallin family)
VIWYALKDLARFDPMTGFSRELLFLSRAHIEAVGLGMGEIVTAVEEAFREKGNGNVEMPPKPGIYPAPDAFIHAMPAYLPKMRSAGIKWVSGFPSNPKLGLPYISGLIILNDPDTGLPLAVMDATWVTAKRTGAATAVAAKHLARKDSTSFGILGCGVQGRTNLEALREVLPNLQKVRAYDTSESNLKTYVGEMTARFELDFTPVHNPREAVEDSDVIVTAGPILKNPTPTIESTWIKNGVFACPIDFDSYWKPAAMHSMHKFCTDDTDQLLHFKSTGYFQNIPNVYADLGQIVAGRKLGRENDEERIMSMNLGLAIEDMAVAVRLYERAKKLGIGNWLTL